MKRIFIDTWAWIAINDPSEKDYQLIRATHVSLIRQKYRYVTSNFVLDETYTLMRRKLSTYRTIQFGQEIQRLIREGEIINIEITSDVERDAWRLFELYDDVNGLSYTDCTSFAAMKRHDLRQAFTNDKHFAMAGFELMPQ